MAAFVSLVCPSCGALQEDRLSEEVDRFPVDSVTISYQKTPAVDLWIVCFLKDTEVYDVAVRLTNGNTDTLSIESEKCMIVPCDDGHTNTLTVREVKEQKDYFYFLYLTDEMMEQVQELQRLSPYKIEA